MREELSSHIENLESIVFSFGKSLNLNSVDMKKLVLSARAHDIGKIFIPDEIMYKKEKLSNKEFSLIKKHPVFSYIILLRNNVDKDIRDIALCHHERIDGRGYPFGLASNQIPKLSKIIAICDSYEAMTANRVYKKAMTIDEALIEIEENLNTQFDYELGKKFISHMQMQMTNVM